MGLGQQREGTSPCRFLTSPQVQPKAGSGPGLPLVRPGLGRAAAGESHLRPPAPRQEEGWRPDREPSASCCSHRAAGLPSVRSESTVSTSAGQSQAPDGSFSLQGPTLTRGNCYSDPSVIIRPQTSLIHYDVPCTPVIQTLMVGRGQPVESRLKQSRPEACPGASGPSPRAAPSRQAQLCHQSTVCQPGARGPRNATFQPFSRLGFNQLTPAA